MGPFNLAALENLRYLYQRFREMPRRSRDLRDPEADISGTPWPLFFFLFLQNVIFQLGVLLAAIVVFLVIIAVVGPLP